MSAFSMDNLEASERGPTQRRPGLSNSLLLHLRPTHVPARAIRLTRTFGLGGIAIVLILVLMCSGLLMSLYYDPAPERAYTSVLGLHRNFLFGGFLRGVHYWSAYLLVVVAGLHLLRVFLTGAYHPPRRANWFIGLALLFSILSAAFTGYLLPWDQLAYWAITVSTEMLTYVPIIGDSLKNTIVGGDEVGSTTAIIFYAIHTSLLPVAFVVLITWHAWQVRLAGGVVLPPAGNESADRNDTRVRFVPELLLREIVAALVAIAVSTLLAVVFGAPLGDAANPGLSPNPAKAPWYFQGLQESLLHFHPLFAVVVIPLSVLAALVAIPFLRGEHPACGMWLLSERGRRTATVAATLGLLATSLFILADEILIGADGWWPGAAPVVSQGLIPTLVIGLGLTIYYQVLRTRYAATLQETVQALFVLFAGGFIVLTATGIWFRGEGLTLAWPW